ncbi:MAG: hypothetical protein ABW213_00095 [Tardiphaga sp.]
MMDVAEFEDLLGRLGDDLKLWPENRRNDAVMLLDVSEPARVALAEARLLRSALRAEPVRAPAGLMDRIMQKVRAPAEPSEQADAGPDRGSRRPREDGHH